MQAPRVAARRDKTVHALLDARDHHGALAEIHLELLARPRFKAHRGARGRTQRLAQRRHRPLDGAQRHRELVLALQRLAHDIRIAVMLMETGREPRLQRVQNAHAC